MSSWPDGVRRALTQCEHEQWNSWNYPGTRQLCCKCDQPTGNCEEDSLRDEDFNVYCSDCYNQLGISIEKEGK